MKQRKTFITLLCAFLVAQVNAGSWTDSDTGIVWSYSVNSEGTVSISGVSNASGEVTLPSSIEGKPVVSIAYNAFKERTGISKIVVPRGVLSVNTSAFYKCSLVEIVLPEGLTSIGPGAFRYCYSLKKITMPDSVKTIGAGAFHDCKSLEELIIPSSVTEIKAETFLNCSSLTNLVIPNSVVSILTSAPYPDAFQGCTSLVSMTIPQCMCSTGCSVKVPTSVTNVVVAEGVKVIGSWAFRSLQIKNFHLPESLVSIEGGAFARNSQIESICIPSGVTSIGAGAFEDCNNLQDVTLPNSLTNISAIAFSRCTSLSELSLPNSVDMVAPNAFEETPLGSKIYAKLLKLALNENDKNEIHDVGYSLTNNVADRAIANVEISGNTAIDSFVLKYGKVYDCALRIVNTSDSVATVSLPSGYVYEKFLNTNPLEIPATSTNILTITRTTADTFLLAREVLTLESE